MDIPVLTRRSSCVIGLFCFGAATPAAAITMTATYTGTVESSVKVGSAFGLADGVSLDGYAADVVFVYDPRAPGVSREVSGNYQVISGGSVIGTVPPVTFAAITINGVTVSVPTDTSVVYTLTDHTSSSQMFHMTNGGKPNEDHWGYNQSLVYLSARAISEDPAAIPLRLEESFALTDPLPSSREVFVSYQCDIDLCDSPEEFSSYVVANIRYQSLTVTGEGIAPVPVPPAGLFLFAGIGALGGLRGLHRRARRGAPVGQDAFRGIDAS